MFLAPSIILKLKRICTFFIAMCLYFGAASYLLALISYSPADSSFNSFSTQPIQNFWGEGGAIVADIIFQIIGVLAVVPFIIIIRWSTVLITQKPIPWLWLRAVIIVPMILLLAIAMSTLENEYTLFLPAGAGGASGTVLVKLLLVSLGITPEDTWYYWAIILVVLIIGLMLFHWIINIPLTTYLDLSKFIVKKGRVVNFSLNIARKTFVKIIINPVLRAVTSKENSHKNPDHYHLDPSLGPDSDPQKKDHTSVIIKPKLANKSSSKKARQGSLIDNTADGFNLPTLSLLEIGTNYSNKTFDKDSLRSNAVILTGVLQDFGIKGKIIKISPGPVVTLYELEPSPGTKTSRVVSLSEDIARSMSAISVRIAVIPGKSVIGIEMPNERREKVYFSEMLISNEMKRFNGQLTLALGKNISGKPIYADLSQMPHLLIAGTTGSGKSVAINTMILSLLYNHAPNKVKLLMIDPKMLELSMYDGIPHLLAPVVTEPQKAVTALKWIVREMENRYRSMSQLSVRNIAGYNQRLEAAEKSKTPLTQTVEIGFDPETGKPIYEDKTLNLSYLPHIIVIIDEMADLMLVAGKDVEAAVQRLAQMARAAGIHLIMATQRPSVDVITGTIKANFPTRISFQVTSKIDSRTILGEQGAEQLLGMGDMLFMAAGGRITRVHAPFISDDEVQSVVNHLKVQGKPDYLEEITSDEAADVSDIPGFGNLDNKPKSSSDILFDQAVQLIALEQKASTSFVQRHLQIGYNRAARIIEEMESQGMISKPNHVGKREVFLRNNNED